MRFTSCPKKEASIEEVNIEETDENDAETYRTENDETEIKNLGRLEIEARSTDIKKVLEYNILKRQSDDNIQTWKSYPGISKIVETARNVIEKGDTSNIGELAKMMQVHESQQSASIIATIAILVGSKLNEMSI